MGIKSSKYFLKLNHTLPEGYIFWTNWLWVLVIKISICARAYVRRFSQKIGHKIFLFWNLAHNYLVAKCDRARFSWKIRFLGKCVKIMIHYVRRILSVIPSVMSNEHETRRWNKIHVSEISQKESMGLYENLWSLNTIVERNWWIWFYKKKLWREKKVAKVLKFGEKCRILWFAICYLYFYTKNCFSYFSKNWFSGKKCFPMFRNQKAKNSIKSDPTLASDRQKCLFCHFSTSFVLEPVYLFSFARVACQ